LVKAVKQGITMGQTLTPPRISIVTPYFNQGEFLEECIDSILGQNYPD
jgi:cellulose synthase/poly-beta-1,6-N-acetylglucosamine synthase-like glycosyltransferase